VPESPSHALSVQEIVKKEQQTTSDSQKPADITFQKVPGSDLSITPERVETLLSLVSQLAVFADGGASAVWCHSLHHADCARARSLFRRCAPLPGLPLVPSNAPFNESIASNTCTHQSNVRCATVLSLLHVSTPTNIQIPSPACELKTLATVAFCATHLCCVAHSHHSENPLLRPPVPDKALSTEWTSIPGLRLLDA
jgi:hypothetical protein